ncbi:PREDICTED: putative POM121-like protein 1-like [Elephantulus edwardii]|uniref:putative POM121-like protein 1-like n=1 Tax=Elephantulus edwardii TaxID=28737 RepID=UPI0003F0EA85|nr:PREDICTED: putative POM121-like protein 1-like [Elephantulus edwardii]
MDGFKARGVSEAEEASGVQGAGSRVLGMNENSVAAQEEDQQVCRPGPESPERKQSAGRVVLTPKPGPLQTAFHSQSSQGRYKRPCESHILSSCTIRNGITSSYSSSRACPPVKKRRRVPVTSHSPLLLGSRQRLNEKALEPGTSAAGFMSNLTPCTDSSRVSSGQERILQSCALPCDSSKPRRCKTPLLPPRQGLPLVLPTAPDPGCRVTSHDLDVEKEAVWRSIKKLLAGDKEASPSGSSPQTPGASPLSCAWAAPTEAAPPGPKLTQTQNTWGWGSKQGALDLQGTPDITQHPQIISQGIYIPGPTACT